MNNQQRSQDKSTECLACGWQETMETLASMLFSEDLSDSRTELALVINIQWKTSHQAEKGLRHAWDRGFS